MVILEMMTLGKMSHRLLEVAEKENHHNEDHLQPHFDKFFESNLEKLEVLYPLSFPTLLKMLEKDFSKRPLPSQIAFESKEEEFKDN